MKRGVLQAAPCKKRSPACVAVLVYPCGKVMHSFQKDADFGCYGLLCRVVLIRNHTGTRFAVEALLLVALPLLLTFANCVELPPRAVNVHQLAQINSA